MRNSANGSINASDVHVALTVQGEAYNWVFASQGAYPYTVSPNTDVQRFGGKVNGFAKCRYTEFDFWYAPFC